MPGITDPAEEYFKDGAWGWNGSAWRKAGLLFSYSDQLMGMATDLDGAGGTTVLLSPAVPAGEVWVATALEQHDATSGVSSVFLGVRVGETMYVVGATGALAAAVGFSWSGQAVLVEGDKFQSVSTGCTAGDDLYFYWFGYKMAI